jgi:uncharacterized membrane protein YhaH (DUF805 family)
MDLFKEYALYIEITIALVVCILAIVLTSRAKNLIGKKWLVAGNILLLFVWVVNLSFQIIYQLSQEYRIYDWFQLTNLISDFRNACFAVFFLLLWANTRIKINVKDLLFSFNGRIPRSLFWIVGCIMFPLGMSIGLTVAATETKGVLNVILWIIYFCWLIISLWIALSVYAKRWHDCGKSGWMSLILLIPIIGSIWLVIYLGFIKGTAGNNEFGDDLLAVEEKELITNTGNV